MAIPIIATLLTDEEFELFITKCISKSVKEELKALLAVPESINTILTRQETAKLLAISLPTLHDYTKRGLIKAYRLGCKVRYKREDVEMALKQIKNGIK